MELFCLYYTSQFIGEVTAGLKKKRGRLAWSLGRFNSASKFKIQMISKNIKVIIPCYQPNVSIEGLEMKLLKCKFLNWVKIDIVIFTCIWTLQTLHQIKLLLNPQLHPLLA